MDDELKNPIDASPETPAAAPAESQPAPTDEAYVEEPTEQMAVPHEPWPTAEGCDDVVELDKPADETPARSASEDEAIPARSASEESEESESATEAVEEPAAAAEAPKAAPKPRPAKAAPAREPVELPEAPSEPKSENMQWYILKVQSNREDSIRQGLQRRVKIAGLEHYFGDVIIPIEKVTEVKGGRKRVIKRKLYPGYLVIQMEINDDTWFLVRETPGIGDFTGAAGRPSPMLPHEVARIVSTQEEKADAAPKLKIGFKLGDRVKINEGTFENFEGEVETIDEASGRVTVMINIFGRSTPVELEYWQVESL